MGSSASTLYPRANLLSGLRFISADDLMEKVPYADVDVEKGLCRQELLCCGTVIGIVWLSASSDDMETLPKFVLVAVLPSFSISSTRILDKAQ